jgi:hypothetical protein
MSEQSALRSDPSLVPSTFTALHLPDARQRRVVAPALQAYDGSIAMSSRRLAMLTALVAIGVAGCGSSSHSSTRTARTGVTRSAVSHASFVAQADAVCRAGANLEGSLESEVSGQTTFAGIANVLRGAAVRDRSYIAKLEAIPVASQDRALADKWLAALRSTLAAGEQALSVLAKVPAGAKSMNLTQALEVLGTGFLAKLQAVERTASQAHAEYKSYSKALGLSSCGTK